MPTERGLSLRGTGSLRPYRNWLRDGHSLKPRSGGIKAVKDSHAPSGTGLRIRGVAVVQPNQRSSDHPMAHSSHAKARMSPESARGRQQVEAAFHEVNEDEPAIMGKTRRKHGAAAAKRQKVAIALSKARAAGVRIPKR